MTRVADSESKSSVPLDEEARWVTIHVLDREDAIAEGVLVTYQYTTTSKTYDVCFTDRLYEMYRHQEGALTQVVQQGMTLLAMTDPSDDEYQKVRVVIPDFIWVVADRYGITFLEPADY